MSAWPIKRTPADIASDRQCCSRSNEDVKANIEQIHRANELLMRLVEGTGDQLLTLRNAQAERMRWQQKPPLKAALSRVLAEMEIPF